MTTVAIELTKEDKNKIRSCDYYLHTKTIMQSHEDYQYHEAGTVVQIKHKQEGHGRADYIGDGGRPYKFLIIEKDGGFLFAKRIISTGKPGELVTCLTIEYPSDRYEIEVEPDMADAMLLDAEYDPLKAEKEYKSKKGKATRLNDKKKITFNDAAEAYEFVKNLKPEEVFYMSTYSYGGEITTFKVKEVKTSTLTDREKQDRWLNFPAFYVNNGFNERVVATLEVVTSECRYTRGSRELEFFNLINKDIGSNRYSWNFHSYYRERPIKPTDIQ